MGPRPLPALGGLGLAELWVGKELGGLGFQFPVFAIGKRRIGELLREYLDHDLGHYVLHRLPVSERNFADVFVGFGTQVYGVLLYHDIIVY